MSDFLCARRLSRSYPVRQPGSWRRSAGTQALDDLTLSLPLAGRVGLVGTSGSGKTTLLRCLLALDQPDSGEIRCEGRLVRPHSAAKLRWYRRLVQYIPQDPGSSLDPRMTVTDLVVEPLVRLHVKGDHRALVAAALDDVQIPTGLGRRRGSELSGGQGQRVAIARAVVTRPRYLLADEPVSGLDLPLRDQVIGVLDALSRSHQTGILFVSHDLSAVAQLCERTVVMSDGKIIEDRPTHELLATPRHRLVRELIASVPRLPVRPAGVS
jgi:peptide/nickel transport system ATP-binding protein